MSQNKPKNIQNLTEEERMSGARERRRSRYDSPRTHVSWFALILGIIVGIVGGLSYTWTEPVDEYDVSPNQLSAEDLDYYLVAIILDYNYDGDLEKAVNRLLELDLPGNDPLQAVADTACRLATSRYANSSSGLRAIRSMMAFYQSQERKGCADEIIVTGEIYATTVVEVDIPTATLMPPASKTPTPPGAIAPSPTPPQPIIPTTPPENSYNLVAINNFCDVELGGLIEVFIQNYNGQGVPGQPIRVRWDSGESTFFTGLKPERGAGYADFKMEAGIGYIIDMPGLSEPSSTPLLASDCFTEGGNQSITSYRVVFQGG